MKPSTRALVYAVSGGEQVKKWRSLEECLTVLAENRIERGARFVALGGGACLDLGAFAASLYRRGMPLILVPSTLLGAVDAAIGGKTAVDFERIKNFAGTFYFANEVWIAPHLFATLSFEERRSGAGELWKTLWISGDHGNHESIFHFVRTGETDKKFLSLLKKSIETKKNIVQKDPFDSKRIREILNFGHTAGHALESLAKGKLRHGEAILWGMAIESQIVKSKEMNTKLKSILLSLELKLPDFSVDKNSLVKILLADKKMKKGMIEFAALKAPGKPIKTKMKPEKMAEAILAFLATYQREGKHLLM